jgi:hypothetical protein
MEHANIAPVIKSGIKIIENTIEDMKVIILDSEMQKSLPTEKFPEGLHGVNIILEWSGVGSKKAFISSRFCESMHTNYGDQIAKEFILPLFDAELKKNR